MHNSSMKGLEPEEDKKPIYAVVFGSVIAIGLPLNILSLWIFLRHHSLRSPSIVFMVNLAISDLLLVISLPMRVYFYATGTWPLTNMACIWITMLFRNNIRSSAIFITIISVDRLLAVVYPLKSRQLRTPSKACKAAVVIWLLLLVVNIPESVNLSRFLNNHTEPACFDFHPPQVDVRLHRSGVAYFQLVVLFTMLAVNIMSTVLVSWTLHKNVNDSAIIRNKVNVMLIFAMNLMMFTLFFLPVSLALFFNHLRPALNCLASVNCCLDPLLYYFSFDGFWRRKEDVDSSIARE
ncbi:lysophosphatidic acid receptor 5b [Gouania willdenowi]|uniref:lysophosphatidic acid receptor 5b n=1 Tax=Gouania willdenowi TaxID=441366 RepID=UPI001054E8D0|nr:lysophosphatidic acid receptor 6-like [Gouania willdenowi]